MTAFAPTAVHARVRASRIAIASDDALAIGALTALFAALLALTWGTWGNVGGDTGYDLVAGAHVAHGQLPYIDFVYHYGPLAPFVLGFAALVGGSSLAPAIAVGLVLTIAIAALTYALGRMLAGTLGGFLAAAIVVSAALAPTNFSYVLPHTEAATLGLALLLGMLVALNRSSLATAGVCAGLAGLTRPELEGAVLVALAGWLVLRARSERPLASATARLLAPALLIPAAVYGAFLAVVPAHRLFFENLYPLHGLRSTGDAVMRLQAPLTAASFGSLGLKLVAYAAIVAVLVLLARGLDLSLRPAALVAAGATLGIVAAVARPGSLVQGLQLAYGWIPAGAAIAVVLLLALRRSSDSLLPAALALAALAAVTYAAFYLDASRAQPAVYAAPLAALFLVRLHLVELPRSRSALALGVVWLAFLAAAGTGLAVRAAQAKPATVSDVRGTLHASARDAAVYREALHWIDAAAPVGKPVFLAPQLTALYALSGRTDPLPQLSLLPGALPTPAAERAAIARLSAADIKLAVTDRRSYAQYGQTFFGGSYDRLVADWIRTHYRHAATLGGLSGPVLDVWVKSPEDRSEEQ